MGVQLPSEPINRHEQYLAKIAGQAVEIPAEPLTREEAYLDYIAKHGGGGGGTGDYDELLNQPKINDVTLKGNKSASDLGLASASALANKVDKVAGKDLSSNDYSDSEKQKNADNATAISAIKDGATIDSFADVESALSNKQDTLTAGDYISLNNGNIAVNRNIVRDNYAYNIKFSGDNDLTVTKSQGGTVISTTQYTYEYGSGGGVTYTIDDAFTLETIYYGGQYFKYTALRDSTTHSAGYTWQVEAHDTSTDVTEYFPTEDLSGYKLVIKSELDAAISSAYHHAGTKTCAELVVGLLVAANEGNVYNMTDSGTTTSDFIEGAGQPIKAGDNVGVAKISDGVYKFDLLSGFVDTSNFVQKSVTAGLLKNDGTVNDEIEGDVSTLKSGLTNLTDHVDGDATTYTYADVITINDAVPANLADCSVKIDPVQDLHGYDKPWVGGAGKNKLPLTTAKLKADNYSGTWNGNVYSYRGIDFTITEDNAGNVIEIDVNGTAVADYAKLDILNASITQGSYKLNGISGGSQTTLRFDLAGIGDYKTLSDRELSVDASTDAEYTFSVNVRTSGTTVSHQKVYPMIRLATETDSTFAPYTNICPISGHTEAVVTRDGNDVWIGKDSYTIATAGHVIPNTTITLPAGTYALDFEASNPSGVFEFEVFKGNSVDWSNRLFDKVFTAKVHNIVKFTLTEASTNLRLYSIAGASISNVKLFSTVQTYTIALGDTIYGGTVDFDSGVMVVDRAVIDLGTLTWTLGNQGQAARHFYSNALSSYKYIDDNTVNYICENYEGIPVSQRYKNGTVFINSAKNVSIKDDNYNDTTAFTNAMDGVQLCYELATPTTIQLTPKLIQLLKGQNTLYASTGDISVSVNGVSGAIGAVQEQANATDNALAQLAADIAEQLPDAPTTDGAYVLTVTVADGEATYSWESAE